MPARFIPVRVMEVGGIGIYVLVVLDFDEQTTIKDKLMFVKLMAPLLLRFD